MSHLCDNAQTVRRARRILGAVIGDERISDADLTRGESIMNTVTMGDTGRPPRFGLTLQIIRCITLAVLLTGTAWVAASYTLDLVGPAIR